MTLLDTLAIVAPVFLTIGAGALAVRRGRIGPAQVDGLMIFGQSVAIPCLLFRAVTRLDFATTFDVRLLLAFYGGSASCFLIGAFGARLFLARGGADAVVLGFSSLYCNAVLLGLPITERAFGKAALSSNILIISFQAAVCYMIGVTAMEVVRAEGDGAHRTAIRIGRSLIRHPHMLALFAGLCVKLAGVTLPAFAMTTIDMIGAAALPASLFGLGGVLSRYRLRGSLPAVFFVSGVSLVVRPAIVLGLATLVFALPQAATRSAVMTAAMAPGVNTFLFASMYGHARDVTASAVLLGTLLSIVTATLWIIVLT